MLANYAARLLPSASGFKGAFPREFPRDTASARDGPGEASKGLMVDRRSGGIPVRRTGNLASAVPEESDYLYSGHAVGVPHRLTDLEEYVASRRTSGLPEFGSSLRPSR